ncbi:transcription coactivators [Euphorbia peplus]|nr:transcription coactivators [Euphorbia peplus]
MLKSRAFNGSNVYMSRNLVPPELFDALLDALKLNGAGVFLCCDPSRNGPNDFHVISSPHHEKFEDLRAKGCNLLGPQCVLSCAKQHRALPKQGYTCCLAMDGIGILASGFETDEKVKIEMMVTAMGGHLFTRATLDIGFVIVKNVLAAKYKWSINVLRKHAVTVNWLYQCWAEHRVVPQESYRVLPFTGLLICVTRIPADERKEIEKTITQNGGKYSAELTKACTHLICDISILQFHQVISKDGKFYFLDFWQAPEGDKYKVARRWGHIRIVSRKWFQQSIRRRTCLDEDCYSVQYGAVSSNKTVKNSSVLQHSQEKASGNSSFIQTSMAAETYFPSQPYPGFPDSDLETTLSQNMSSMFSDPPVLIKEVPAEMPAAQPSNEMRFDDCVADDSQSEDDLYLSECRISIVGFEACEMRKLVNIVRRGGGSRYMSFNDKLTHIVVGAPTEVEKRDLRGLAASGVIHVVRPTWLEDCDREKKEIPVVKQHIAYDLLLPKDSMVSNKGVLAGTYGTNQGKTSGIKSSSHPDKFMASEIFGDGIVSSLEKNREVKPKINTSRSADVRQSQQNLFSVSDQRKGGNKMQPISSSQNQKASNVFKGKSFCFSNSFPEDRRAEIVHWVSQGGGEMVEDHAIQNVHFIIECHGVVPRSMAVNRATCVSSHWVRACLEGESLLDVCSHIIFSPLSCQIPLPGFENFRFCISQFEEKDRILLRNLSFVLGAKFVEKLTRKVTHLLLKFTEGPKYEAACKWGICSITPEWIYECVRQNKVVTADGFQPKEVTSQDRVAGSYVVSQAFGMLSGDSSQFISQSQELRSSVIQTSSRRINSSTEEAQKPIDYSKKARLLESSDEKVLLSSGVGLENPIGDKKSVGDDNSKDNAESSHSIPDVAAAIEDLLEQTSKIHDQQSLGETGCDKNLYSSDPILGEEPVGSRSVIGLPNHWLNRTGKKDEATNSSRDINKSIIYDGFSETQTESQVVVYEEDLSGRQMLIDKVRTRSSLT